ncbi:MAG: hypothetical protein ACXVPU_12505 [Bacteroidia bacterium]
MNKLVVAVMGLSKFTISAKIEFQRFIVTSMTGNPSYVTPSPTLVSLTTAGNNLETAYISAKGGGKDETANMHAKEAALDLLLTSIGSYAQGIANANPLTAEAVLLSAGINTKKTATARPNGFRISAGNNSGEIQIRTDSSARAVFTMETTKTPDAEDSWEVLYSGTHSQFLTTGLDSGVRYYFRVAKTDKDGQGPWSNVLNRVVS